jgi:hypothetical protein
MLEVALNYSRLGMIVHPLLNPNAPEINPKTRENYTRSRSDSELGTDGGKIKEPWKCGTIQRELGSITLDNALNSKCNDCTFRGQKKQIVSQKKPEPEVQKDNPLNIDYDEMDLSP